MVLNYASYFGMPKDQLQSVVDFLLTEHMTDGGFNCQSNRSGARHSSLHSTLSVLEGIQEYADSGYRYRLDELQRAADQARDFILLHWLFKSDRTGEVIRKDFLQLSFPPRWFYNILRSLDYFRAADAPWDNRMADAFGVLMSKRKRDGRWRLQAAHPGQVHFRMEEPRQPSRWNTVLALRVLKAYPQGMRDDLQAAKKVYDEHALEKSRTRALILDDSIKVRRGKKIEAVSRHFDHVSNTYVKGQQVLTLGLATEDAFLPLDSQIYVSGSQPQPLIKPYKDGRSIGAKRYQEAIGQSKVEMAVGMMRRAVRAGIQADYVAADAWFGNKEMMRAGLSLDITAILRMKKNKLKYRLEVDGREQRLDAKELYQTAVHKQWKKVRGMPWKAVAVMVDVDLATEKGKKMKPEYYAVKLLFVRGVNEEEDNEGSRKDWALFLSTIQLSALARCLKPMRCAGVWKSTSRKPSNSSAFSRSRPSPLGHTRRQSTYVPFSI